MHPHAFLWPHCSRIPPLGPDEIHVWAFDLDRSPTAEDWSVLGEEETTRAHRFVFPRDCDRYVRAHSCMRVALGAYARRPAGELLFSTAAYGKPELSQISPRIRFNLSHSAGVGVLAAALEFELGIDTEIVRPIDPDIAEQTFSPHELATLNGLCPEEWQRGFFRCWTSKEALLKGEGLGLNLSLDAFDVEASPARPPALLDCRPAASLNSGWQLTELRPVPDAACTLAARRPLDEKPDTHLQVPAPFPTPDVRCFTFAG